MQTIHQHLIGLFVHSLFINLKQPKDQAIFFLTVSYAALKQYFNI